MKNIEVESYPNPDCRTYHTKFEISKSAIENFMRPVRPASGPYLKKVGRTGGCLVRKLLNQSGIAQVTIQPYEVMVEKGKAFNWTEIEPAIFEALKHAMPKDLREAQ